MTDLICIVLKLPKDVGITQSPRNTPMDMSNANKIFVWTRVRLMLKGN